LLHLLCISLKPQTAPRRGDSREMTKSAHNKKTKRKQRGPSKYIEETPEATPQEIAEKTINSLNKLGNQIFALSPFSQYFDDWLINLRQVLLEFETNKAIKVDEVFQKQQARIIQDVESKLAEKRLLESNLTSEAKALAEVNHKIADADKEYAEKNREQNNKRNSEVQRLSARIRQLEDQLGEQQKIKISFYKFKEKRAAAEALSKTEQSLKISKTELEIILANFSFEQEKLHDSYQKLKQDLSHESDRLHKELEELEIDTSIEDRKIACEALMENIKIMLKKMPTQAS
jgi:hypothetical protein